MLITRSDELASQFERALASQRIHDDKSSLQILRDEGDSLLLSLNQVANGGIVGLSSVAEQESCLRHLPSKFRHLRFFDYKVVLSEDHKTHRVRGFLML